MNPGSIVSGLVGIIGATWLGIAGGWLVWQYDRGGADNWSYTLPIPFWHPVLHLPLSMAGKLAEDLREQAQWRAAFDTLQVAFDDENQAVLSLKTSADAYQARSTAAVSAADKANAWRLTLAKQLEATPAPADTSELALCEAADAVLKAGAP